MWETLSLRGKFKLGRVKVIIQGDGGAGKLCNMARNLRNFWSGLPFPPPGDLPDPVIEPRSPSL